jgi:hypothetical protein
MQRLLTLVFLLCLTIPAGISITGCTRNPAGNYCNGEGYGLKLTQVATITLTPQTTGISLAYGQTQQLASPSAKTCKGSAASVASYTYGTTNNQVVDISPTGNLCAGTWNRRTGGGIPDYTTCIIPSPLPTTTSNGVSLPYSTAFVTATGDGISSNAVTVYTHAQVTSVSLVLEKSATDATPVTSCLSQTQTAQLDEKGYYNLNGAQELLCEPGSSSIPNCATAIGNPTFTAQNSSISTINETGVITAVLPGTTYITVSIAGSGSSAGYFSTCPPAKIDVTLNGATSGTVTQGVTQNLVTTITDTNGNTIQGLTLDYQSTNPLDISVGSAGAITANYAGQASIYAVCQPTTCNPSPIDKVGVNQTGTSITSNEVKITTPGTASDYVWMSSPQSQYFTPIELLSGSVGSPVRMPYFPNSMVLDRTGTSLYFGTSTELMIYTTATNTLTKEDPNVPGKVLAVAPNNLTVLINDPIRKLFYLYTPSAGTYTTYSGVGTAAQWTPDAKTLYITGTTAAGAPALFVNNANTGFTTYLLDPVQTTPATNLALTVPGVGAFLSGNPTVVNAWCPELSSANTIVEAYPNAGSVHVPTDVLGATIDGAHIIGAKRVSATSATLYDIGVSFADSLDNGACPSVASGGTFTSTNITKSPVTTPAPPSGPIDLPANVEISALNQVVVSPGSNLAFVTYTPATGSTGTATLPYYEPNTSGTLGTLGQVTFVEPASSTSPATAPLAGAFSLDDNLFFVSTSGDNLVHYITVSTLKDTKQIAPGLVDASGNVVPAQFIAAKPRPTT